MLEIGSLVDGKYKILNEIGHGGMSVVYLAIVERANQTWAIKEVRKNGATKDDIVQQGLVAEMNILKRLNHPHLPRIIDIIDYDDSFLIVMDYIEGIDLDKRLRKGPQKWEDVVDWAKQLCDVFAYLHSRTPPIIYRDMKPGNVKLKPDGNVVLFDFGTAREYKSQKAGDDTTCLGTRGYASPEQYGGMGQTDARSDIYCLGATMYHLVTGQMPGGPPNYQISPIRQICPWLPRTGKDGNSVRGLEHIISKCLRQNPADRYQNCTELMYDLENIDRISAEFVVAQKKKLRTWIVTSALAVIFAIIGVAGLITSSYMQKSEYEGYMKTAVDLFYENPNPESGGDVYNKIKESLENAKQTENDKSPSPEALIYLSRLFKSDYNVSDDEIIEFNTACGNPKLDNDEEIPDEMYSAYLEFAQYAFLYYKGTGMYKTKGSVSETSGASAQDIVLKYVRLFSKDRSEALQKGNYKDYLNENADKSATNAYISRLSKDKAEANARLMYYINQTLKDATNDQGEGVGDIFTHSMKMSWVSDLLKWTGIIDGEEENIIDESGEEPPSFNSIVIKIPEDRIRITICNYALKVIVGEQYLRKDDTKTAAEKIGTAIAAKYETMFNDLKGEKMELMKEHIVQNLNDLGFIEEPDNG